MITRRQLIDGNMGVYIPMIFYNNFTFSEWGLDMKDYPELSSPENGESYWDAWGELLAQATHTDPSGVTWTLEQDGDLFAVTGEDEENE